MQTLTYRFELGKEYFIVRSNDFTVAKKVLIQGVIKHNEGTFYFGKNHRTTYKESELFETFEQAKLHAKMLVNRYNKTLEGDIDSLDENTFKAEE